MKLNQGALRKGSSPFCFHYPTLDSGRQSISIVPFLNPVLACLLPNEAG